MTHEDFIKSGFKLVDSDPIMPYQYDLLDREIADPEDFLCVAWSREHESFAIASAMGVITFNALSPERAVRWAKAITMFEANY